MSGETTVMAQPHDIVSERYVLGAMLQDPEAVQLAVRELAPADFYEPRHQVIFSALAEAAPRYLGGFDVPTVVSLLEAAGTREQAGGYAALLDLIEEVYATTNTEHHVRVLRDRRVRREVRLLCQRVGRAAADLTVDAAGLIDELRGALPALERGPASGGVGLIREWILEAVNTMTARDSADGKLAGLSTGVAALDELIDGLMPQRMYCLAGYTGCGKSAMAQQLSVNLARAGHGVGYWSRELPEVEMLGRWIAMLSGGRLSYRELERGLAAGEDVAALRALRLNVASQLADMNIAIVYGRATSRVEDFERWVRRLVYDHGTRVIVVDYIQKMRGDSRERYQTRTEMLTDIADRCKDLAVELNIVMVVLAQVDRSVQKDNRRPTSADLRESSGIAESSDVVLLLHALCRALTDEVKDDKRPEGVLQDYAQLAVQLILDKGRALGSDTRWVYGFRPFGRMLSGAAPSRGRECIGQLEADPDERARLYAWWRDYCQAHDLEAPRGRHLGLDSEREALLRLAEQADEVF